MIIKVYYKFFTVGILAMLSTLVSAQGVAPTDLAAEKLSAVLAQTRSFQARVIYLELDQNGRLLDEKQVDLHLRKPDQLSWHVVSPYEQLMVTDGEKLWTWEPDLEQVQIDSFPDDVSQNPVLMLSADAQTLKDRYEVAMSSVGELDRFTLYPRDIEAQFTQLTLTFDEAVMTEMHLEGTYGDKVSFTFTGVKTNIELPDALFMFDIPPGAMVLDTTEE